MFDTLDPNDRIEWAGIVIILIFIAVLTFLNRK